MNSLNIDLFRNGTYGKIHRLLKLGDLPACELGEYIQSRKRGTIILAFKGFELCFVADKLLYLSIENLDREDNNILPVYLDAISELRLVKREAFEEMALSNGVSFYVDPVYTFSDQVCLRTESGCRVFFDQQTEEISAIFMEW